MSHALSIKNDSDDYVCPAPIKSYQVILKVLKVEEITEEKKQEILEAINERFSFSKDGSVYCRECKNEPVACVCM